jgi:hypothetical protein
LAIQAWAKPFWRKSSPGAPVISGHLDTAQSKTLDSHHNKHTVLRLGEHPIQHHFNTTIATAIADRLVENSEVFLLGGESLRKPKNPNPPAEKS